MKLDTLGSSIMHDLAIGCVENSKDHAIQNHAQFWVCIGRFEKHICDWKGCPERETMEKNASRV